jgi:hypothetical protein
VYGEGFDRLTFTGKIQFGQLAYREEAEFPLLLEGHHFDADRYVNRISPR